MLSIPNGLTKEGTLVRRQGEGFCQGRLIAVIEPGGQAQRNASQVDILGNQAGIDKIIGFLDLGIKQARFRESGGLELFEIDHIDQAGGGIGTHGRPARSDCQGAEVAGEHRGQMVEAGSYK